MNITPRKRIANPPIEHFEFPHFLSKSGTKVRIRIIQYHHPKIGSSEPMLDIREYIENKINPDKTIWTGWSRAGVSLRLSDLKALLEIIPTAMEKLTEMGE